jgi:hypothetical protein
MDSLLAIELRNSLATLFARKFPSSLLFDYPSLRALARFIEQEIFPANTEEPISPNTAETAAPMHIALAGFGQAGSGMTADNDSSTDPLSILDEIEQLSDVEVDTLLGRDLHR